MNNITPGSFLCYVKKRNIAQRIHNSIKNLDKSPLKYAFVIEKSNDEANDIEHSFRVLKNCNRLASNISEKLAPSDYLILFYSALLHDISKSRSPDIKKDLESLVHKGNKLFSDANCDHGVRSAYYLKQKENNKVIFYGLNEQQVQLMYNIIAFHSSAKIHSAFRKKKTPSKDILLCLLLWLADVADGVCDRVLAAATVEEKTAKVKAREEIGTVNIKKDTVCWVVKRKTKGVKEAAKLGNNELAKHKLLLQAFGLPSEILLVKKGDKQNNFSSLSNEDLAKSNLSVDLKGLKSPLVISVDSLPEAYENIVEAFQNIEVKGQAKSNHYFGPLVVEINNIQDEKTDMVFVRNNQGFDIEKIKSYTKNWLDAGKNAADTFYFGYTHGQRIHKYVYPKEEVDLSKTDFYEWHGKRKQLEIVKKILSEEGRDARRAYLVIAHPIIDNSDKSDTFHKDKVVQPALIAIHFRIEKKNRLSAYAFLRSQEMSTFFLVNYFELKDLIEKLSKQLSVKCGRIVMSTSLAYFDKNTTLLDKPALCLMKDSKLRNFSIQIEKRSIRNELIKNLEEIEKRNYMKTEYGWCAQLRTALLGKRKYYPLKKAIKNVENSLKETANAKSISIIPKSVIDKKSECVKVLISLLENWSNE